MTRLLIVYHSQTGTCARMANAVIAGANHPDLGTEVTAKLAREATVDDMLTADALLLGTPENFGYMSGALKDFFDRTFYEVEGKLSPLPYALIIGAGNDGSGAIRAINRIANGYPFTPVQDPIVSKGEPGAKALAQCRELGMAMAAGLALGIF